MHRLDIKANNDKTIPEQWLDSEQQLRIEGGEMDGNEHIYVHSVLI